MTIAILEYDADAGKPKRFKVRGGQSVLIGSSNSADIRLANPDQVAAQHCEVTFASGTLSVKNLTESGQIRVNGDVVNRQRLSGGDLLEIGTNRLKVILQSEPATETRKTSPPIAPAIAVAAVASTAGASEAVRAGARQPSEPDDAASDENSASRTEAHPATDPAEEHTRENAESEALPRLEIPKNGLRVGLVSRFDADLLPLMQGETSDYSMALLINHRASGLDGEAPEQTNLLSELPPDLAESNDLYLCSFPEAAELVNVFDQYANKNAATLLIRRTGDPIAEEDIQMLAAWFLTPGNAKYNFINGTNLLLERVFSVVDAVLVRDTDNKMDMLMLFDGTVTDWQSLLAWLQEEQGGN